MSMYDKLVGGLLVKENRDSYKSVVAQLKLPEPYDELVKGVYKFDVDITEDELLKYFYSSLPSIMDYKGKFTGITDAVFRVTVNDLLNQNLLRSITEELGSAKDFSEQINSIKKILDSSTGATETSKAALVSEVDDMDLPEVYYDFCGYHMSKGHYWIISAYTGIGKTRTLLSIAKDIKKNKPEAKVLYISIADWTTAELKRNLSKAGVTDIYIATYDGCNLSQILTEIESVKPDVTIIDYLGVVDYPSTFSALRHGIAWLSDQFKKIAIKYDTLVLTGYQLGQNEAIPTSDMLHECKAGLLKPTDGVVALGVKSTLQHKTERNLVCFKVRHQPFKTLKKIEVNPEQLEVTEL